MVICGKQKDNRGHDYYTPIIISYASEKLGTNGTKGERFMLCKRINYSIPTATEERYIRVSSVNDR